MQQAIVVKGKLIGPTQVELSEPVQHDPGNTAVEVIVYAPAPEPARHPATDLAAFLLSLPPGTRSKEDIDQQIREERDSWGDR